MKDTIFVPSFGNRPRNLVGREDVMLDFETSLSSQPGSRERAIVLVGQRGYGKTVLLLELAKLAKEKGYIVASPTIVSQDMPERVLEKIMSEAEDIFYTGNRTIAGGSVSIMGFGAGIQMAGKENRPSFAKRLHDICQKINRFGHPVLILIDEVQAHNEYLKQLIIAYQEMVGEGMDLSLVMAGLPTVLSSVLNEHVLTFLNRASKINLEPLRINDIDTYYAQAFATLNIPIDKEKTAQAAEKTKGSPYMMQLIGHYITIMSEEGNAVDDRLFNRAVEKAESDFINDICRTTTAALSDKDMDFLIQMSIDKDESDLSEIASRMGVSSAYVQTYKRRLTGAGVIEQHRRGKVRFAIPYLRDYLQTI